MKKKKPQTKKSPKTKKPKAEEKKPESGIPQQKIERFQRPLRVELSEQEYRDAADRSAVCIAEHDGKVEQLKADTEHAKARIKDLAAEFRRLSNMVRERATTRPVECERLFDYVKKLIIDTRTDTGEILFQRSMTEAEAQIDLPFKDIDDDFDDVSDPGDGIGEAAEANSKGKKKPKDPKDKKPKDEPKEPPKDPETQPDPSEIDDDVEDNDGDDDKKPEAAE